MLDLIKKIKNRFIGLLTVALMTQFIMILTILFVTLNVFGLLFVVLLPIVHLIYSIVNCVKFYKELDTLQSLPQGQKLKEFAWLLIVGIFLIIFGIIGYCIIIHYLSKMQMDIKETTNEPKENEVEVVEEVIEHVHESSTN